MKKKILLLGGSAQQVVAIRKAKELGYYTILCDYLGDNPGQYCADEFFQVSTTDKEAVLKVAAENRINGIIAYASDPAAPTAAYVAEKLSLPSNPYKSVDILCNKDKFRKFLLENGFNAPVSCEYRNVDDVFKKSENFKFPVIVKPVDSSGSKGVTVVEDVDKLENAANYAFAFSRSRKIIIEEFIEKSHPYLIGGDIFVINGRIVLWGLLNCHRDKNVNSLVPVGKSYPLMLSKENEFLVRKTLQNMVNRLSIKHGAMNVELVIDKDNKVWPIDIGPRNGGNMIPDLLEMIFGVDVVGLSLKNAMGEDLSIEIQECQRCYATYNLHSDKNGIYKNIVFDKKIEKNIVKKNIYKKPGDNVGVFNNASEALGIIFMKFSNEKEMFEILNNITHYVRVVLE